MKRLMILLCSVGLVFAGTYSGGSGTSEDPYQISSLNDLSELCQTSSDWNKYFVQTADIDASATQYWDDTDDNSNGNDYDDANDATSTGNNEGFYPIGNYSVTKFTGSYDGDGHTISGLTIERSTSYTGFIGCVDNGIINDLGIITANISGTSYVGALAGINDENSIITNCYSNGSVLGSDFAVGGLVGGNRYGTAKISCCYSNASVNTTGDLAGGLAGFNYQAILSNCYSAGSVTGADYVGAFCGRFTEGSVENCFATGSVTSAGTYVGGFNGANIDNNCTVNNCFWDTQTTGKATSPDGTGKTTTEMKAYATFTDTEMTGLNTAWDFERDPFDDLGTNEYWDIDLSATINNGYLFLSWQNGSTITLSSQYSGSGTSGDPYQISNLDDLTRLCQNSGNWDKYFIQTADIDASATQYWDDSDDDSNGNNYDDASDATSTGNNEGFYPIGNIANKFMGYYDGNEHVVSNITIDRSSTDIGVFGILAGEVTDLGLSGIDIEWGAYCGGFAAINDENSLISNCYTSGNVTSTGNYVGGFVGGNRYGTAEISSCYSSVNVNTPGDYVGGFAGYSYEAILSNCYSTGNVNAADYVGGLCGRLTAGSVEKCYASGSITATGSNVGGLTGINLSSCAVTDCFWDTQTSGKATSVDGTGKTTSEMKTLATYTDESTSGLTTAWDFESTLNNDAATNNYWDLSQSATVNNGYPFLSWENGTDTALPIEEEPTGNPRQVSSKENLLWISKNSSSWGDDFIQTIDISFSETDFQGNGVFYDLGQGFSPIGNSTTKFTGSFDGDGHTISGLTIDRSTNYIAFFGYSNSCSITELGVISTDITGGSYVSSLVGYNQTSSITKCYSGGSISGNSEYTGGLIGFDNSSTILNSYSTSSISGTDYVGGFCAGFNGSTVTNCYAKGEITSAGTNIGGLNGISQSSTVTDCFWNTETTGKSTSVDGTGKTSTEMKTLATFTDISTVGLTTAWDFETNPNNDTANNNYWDLDLYNGIINSGYPFLSWENGTDIALPNEEEPTGNPRQISSKENLLWISNNSSSWGDDFILTENISFDESDFQSGGDFYNAGDGFSPIGNSTTKFTGSFDGDGHTISGVTIDRSTNYVGFFGVIDNGNLTGLGLTAIDISCGSYSGGLVGINQNGGSVSNCYITGTISSSGSYVGGLVGGNIYTSSEIANCYSTVNVSISGTMAGSLAGYSYEAILSNCYSTGSVSASDYVGALCGRLTRGSVNNCYATGEITSAGSLVGGLNGANIDDECTVTDCFWDTQSTGKATSPDGTGTTTAEMKTLSTFTDTDTPGLTTAWDFEYNNFDDTGTDDFWDIDTSNTMNNGYPFLSWQNGLTIIMSNEFPYSGGSGTESDPYQISNLDDLTRLCQNSGNWDKYFIQTADIDASATQYWDDTDDDSNGNNYDDANDATSTGNNEGFSPIGNNSVNFSGVYNGNGSIIDNLSISREDVSYIGLFGRINACEIKELTISNSSVFGGAATGILAGISNSSSISNCSVFSIPNGFKGNDYSGGLIGYAYNNSLISDCSSNVTYSFAFNNNYKGGLIGYLNESQISNCSSEGVVKGVATSGGLVGKNDNGSITNSYSRCMVSSTFGSAGGLVSNNNNIITNCYSTGSVTAGSFGYSGGLVVDNTGTVSNSFWDTQTSGETTSDGGIGKTTAEMKTLFTFTDASWDFEEESVNGTADIWDLDNSGSVNDGYPFLSWENGTEIALPIVLANFKAEYKDGNVIISWQTASETNNAKFLIYRNNEVIACIEGLGTTSEPHDYVFTDNTAIPSVSYTYVLADISYANEETIHKDKAISITIPENNIPEEFALSNNYPNPFNPRTAISFQLSADSDVELLVIDMNGKRVASLINDNMSAGYYEVNWDASGFNSGIYFYRLLVGDFVDTKKMVFMK